MSADPDRDPRPAIRRSHPHAPADGAIRCTHPVDGTSRWIPASDEGDGRTTTSACLERSASDGSTAGGAAVSRSRDLGAQGDRLLAYSDDAPFTTVLLESSRRNAVAQGQNRQARFRN